SYKGRLFLLGRNPSCRRAPAVDLALNRSRTVTGLNYHTRRAPQTSKVIKFSGGGSGEINSLARLMGLRGKARGHSACRRRSRCHVDCQLARRVFVPEYNVYGEPALANQTVGFLHALQFAGIFGPMHPIALLDRKSTRLNSSHLVISYAVFCL